MVEQELIDAFSKLDINEKRNQINSELEKVSELLNTIHDRYNIEKLPSSIHEYNKNVDYTMSNDKYFTLMYENIIYLRKDIITLVNYMMNNK